LQRRDASSTSESCSTHGCSDGGVDGKSGCRDSQKKPKKKPKRATDSTDCNDCDSKATKPGDIGSASSLTIDEFNKALTDCGYPQAPDKYKPFLEAATKYAKITSKLELAMFLAQVAWESAGLKAKEESDALKGLCNDKYKLKDDVPGKHYWGRGYIQLTWSYNYKAASQALYNSEKLLKNPDIVAKDEKAAWDTAAWFWKENVKPTLKKSPLEFGLTTRAINGKLECDSKAGWGKAKKRYHNFQKITNAFNLDPAIAKESGCYPAN